MPNELMEEGVSQPHKWARVEVERGEPLDWEEDYGHVGNGLSSVLIFASL